MNRKLLYIGGGIVILVLLALALNIFFSSIRYLGTNGSNTSPTRSAGANNAGSGSNPQSAGSRGTTTGTTRQSSAPQVKFDTTTYKQLSQQVFPQPLSSQPSITLDGSTISAQKQADGTSKVVLHINQRGYSDVVVTAQSGDTVYYTSLSYPTPAQDLGDTGLIVVDNNGYVVPQ